MSDSDKSDSNGETDSSSYLIWEDADDKAWWLARSHDEDAVYVIAEDAVTQHILILRQPTQSKDFKVIATVPKDKSGNAGSGIAEGKRIAVRWLGDPDAASIRASVRRWRANRWGKIALRELPLACFALLTGVMLAFIVAAFFIMTNITGWLMIVVGTLFGTCAGLLLKWLADRKLKSLLGPVGRFYTVAGSATLGALLTTSIFFMLFGV